MGGGGSGSTTTTQKSDPWEAQQPYLKQIFSEAGKIYDQGTPQLYPNSFSAARTLPTSLAEEMTLGRALGGSPFQSAGRNTLTSTLQGDYLDPTKNPMFQVGLNKVMDQYKTSIAPQTDSMFARSGAFGGSAHQEKMQRNQQALSEGLNNVNAGIYGQERQNQLNAMSLVPTYNNMDYGDIGKIAAVGSQRDAFNQALIDEAKQRFDYYQGGEGAKKNLQDFQQFVLGNYGGTTTSTQPYYQNQGAGILGGALSGASMGSSIGPMLGMAGPWGAAAGAGLGILGSIF